MCGNASATRSRSSVNSPNPIICPSPNDTFEAGRRLGHRLMAGDVVLLFGGLGAGKTLFSKGVVSALGYDEDDVTSPSFALVNLYRTDKFEIYHIDLWRIHRDAAFAVGLEDILDEPNAVVIIEWAERLGNEEFRRRVFRAEIT